MLTVCEQDEESVSIQDDQESMIFEAVGERKRLRIGTAFIIVIYQRIQRHCPERLKPTAPPSPHCDFTRVRGEARDAFDGGERLSMRESRFLGYAQLVRLVLLLSGRLDYHRALRLLWPWAKAPTLIGSRVSRAALAPTRPLARCCPGSAGDNNTHKAVGALSSVRYLHDLETHPRLFVQWVAHVRFLALPLVFSTLCFVIEPSSWIVGPGVTIV